MLLAHCRREFGLPLRLRETREVANTVNIRFIAADGKEVTIGSVGQFISAVREGQLQPDTLVFDEHEQRWKKAAELSDFSREVDSIQQPSTEPLSIETPSSENVAAKNVEEADAGVAIVAVPPTQQADAAAAGPAAAATSKGFGRWMPFGIVTGFILVTQSSELFRSGFVQLAIALIGWAGVVVGMRRLFRQGKRVARWERVVTWTVLLTMLVAVPIGIVVQAKLQDAAFRKLGEQGKEVRRKFEEEVNRAGLEYVFDVLDGKDKFDRDKLVRTRKRIDGLITSSEKAISANQHLMKKAVSECFPQRFQVCRWLQRSVRDFG